MRRYESYVSDGIRWFGEIPSHWTVSRLKYIAAEGKDTFQDGDWIESNVIVEAGEFRYLTTGNIGEGKYKEQGRSFISKDTFQDLDCLEIFPGDLLMSRLNHPIGRSCIIPELGSRIVTSVDNVVLRPKASFDKRYLVFVTNSVRYYEYAGLIARGATMARVSRTLLGLIEIPVPPLDEQTAIANYLDEKTAQIDTLIEKKQKLIELLKEERKAIINDAVSGEGKNWPTVKFNHYIRLKHGYQFMNYDFTMTGIKVVKITQLDPEGGLDLSQATFISEERLDEFQDIIIKEGDILMALTGGTIGKVVRVGAVDEPLLQNYRVGNFYPANERITKDFIFWIMSSQLIMNQILFEQRETGQPNIGKENFNSFKILLPTIDEQKRVATELDESIKKIEQTINKIDNEIDLILEYKTSLISNVVTGKVKVI